MESSKNTADDNTQSTNSSSAITNLTLLEDASDELSKRILEHHRDLQRMHDATTGTGVQAFKRARPRASLSLTMETLERKNGSRTQNTTRVTKLESSWEQENRMSRKPHSPHESDDSSPLDINVPQQWGRKGRQKNDFLRRLSATSPPNVIKHDKSHDPDAIWPRRTILTGDSPRSDIDWDNSPVRNGDAIGDRHSPLRKALTYDHHGVVRRRKSSIERRMEQMQQEPVTGVIPLDPASTQENDRNGQSDEASRPNEAHTTSFDRKGGRIPRLRQSFSRTIRNADGAAIGTTKAILNGGQEVERRNGDVDTSLIAVKATKAELAEAERHHSRYKYREFGSRDLLKQLAASSTPSPPRDIQRSSRLPTRRSTTPPSEKVQPTVSGEAPANERIIEPDIPTPNAAKSEVKDELVFTDPPQGQDREPPNTTATRAWINAPKLRRSHSNQNAVESPDQSPAEHDMQSKIDPNQLPQKLIPSFPRVPVHAPSAASALILARDENHFGDSTIASLRDLVLQIDDVTTALDDSTVDLVQHVGEPIRTAKRERKEEDDILVRMDERLRAARLGLQDASRGLRKVEREVEEVSSALEESEIRDENGKLVVPRQQGTHASGLCEYCEGVTLSGLIWKAWINWLRNFYFWERRGNWWIPRLTWVGLLCALVLSWWVTEETLCEHYCHQLYGPYMVGYGVNIYAPRMPYVTTTVLIKWPFQDYVLPIFLFVYRLAFGVTEDTIFDAGSGNRAHSGSNGYSYGYDGSFREGVAFGGGGGGGGGGYPTPIVKGFAGDEILR